MEQVDASLIDTATSLVERLKKLGAHHAEVTASSGWDLTARVRLGKVEQVEEAGQRHVSVRAIRDARVALTSTSDLSPDGLARCVNDAWELLALSEPDPDAAPAAPSQLAVGAFPDLETYDPSVETIDAKQGIQLAAKAEGAALEFDSKRLQNSEGATFGRSSGQSALVLSNGFVGTKRGSHVSLVATPVADDSDGKKRRGYYYSVSRYLADLETAEDVGREAARRTLAQLGARSISTCEAPVIFSPDAARAILSAFAGCVVGGALWRRSSYLVAREGTKVASENVTILDDPLIPRGLGSRSFDGEGLACRRLVVVERGVFKTPLLDCLSARKLKREPTGSAARGGGAISSSTSNFVLQPGDETETALIARTPRGLYVTEMMGFGFNPVTGDFSRGASGFWIESGQLQHPVSEVTISSNLDSMLKGIEAVAETPRIRSSIISPAFRVASMTIAGK